MGWFSRLFQPRVHESVVLSGLIATALTLHAMWLAHFILFRTPTLAPLFELSSEMGVISGLYALGASVYVISFLLSLAWWRGKDCSDARDRVFWFFVVSVIMYLILTFPLVYGFEIVARGV